MKKALGVVLMLMLAGTVWGHHAAEGIVDEEVYEMIDAMVADTPHADLDFDEMPGDDMQITIDTTVVVLENLLDDGLLTYIGMLDGDVTVTIEFGTANAVTMTVLQDP